MAKNIFMISGEESGDVHGAALIGALKTLEPDARVYGMGGVRMRQAGLKGLDSNAVSVVGITEVIGRLPVILRALKALKQRLRHEQFDAVVLIDFPDFNLRIAKEAKALHIPVVYYISPQVWAWRRGRLKKIAGLVDKMLVVFPFEERLYLDAGVDVEYVGHPLAEIARCGLTKEEARASLDISTGGPVISLLPGSRPSEVKRLLGPMLAGAEIIEKGLGKKPVFLLQAAGGIEDGFLKGITGERGAGLRVVRGRMYESLRASDAAIVASGTATLETALIGTPMVIVYKVSAVSYRIAKALIGVKHIGLPNIVAGRGIVPELIQNEATAGNIADEVIKILNSKKTIEEMRDSFAGIRKTLFKKGASARAAEAILGVIGRVRAA